MATAFTMLEVSNVGLKREEEEEEIELSLELSIGRSFKKSRKSNPVEEKSTNPIDLNGEIDPKSRRQIQALRRQEARKKREEKLKKSLCKGMDTSGNDGVSVSSFFSDEKVWLETREFEARVRDRERRENEKSEIIRENCGLDGDIKDLNLTLNHGSNSMAPNVYSSIRVGPLGYPYPPFQFVQFTNGFVYPNVMPCWGLVADNNEERSEKKGFEAAACRSFRPYSGNRNSKDGGNRKPVSNGSPGCSSSAVSDYQSSSRQGGSSSDTGSNSSHSQPEQQQVLNSSAVSHPPEQSERNRSGSSNQMESKEAMDKSSNYTANVVSSSIPQSSPVIPSGSDAQPDPVNRPISTTQSPTPTSLKEETKGIMGKPQTENRDTPLPQMPCVSTTGNGPNGKTITGFLYRYTATEVSIVCVCHGNSFSPAEFVEHAGGIDIANPLKHITVVSSAFG